MARTVAVVGLVASLWSLGGCVGICTDSRGEAYGRNWVPFGRRYFMCNGSHCRDYNGQHIDQRCSCSRNCSCWGGGSADAGRAAGVPGACCGAQVADAGGATVR